MSWEGTRRWGVERSSPFSQLRAAAAGFMSGLSCAAPLKSPGYIPRASRAVGHLCSYRVLGFGAASARNAVSCARYACTWPRSACGVGSRHRTNRALEAAERRNGPSGVTWLACFGSTRAAAGVVGGPCFSEIRGQSVCAARWEQKALGRPPGRKEKDHALSHERCTYLPESRALAVAVGGGRLSEKRLRLR